MEQLLYPINGKISIMYGKNFTTSENVLANELFSDLLIPGGDLESMIIQMQWLALDTLRCGRACF